MKPHDFLYHVFIAGLVAVIASLWLDVFRAGQYQQLARFLATSGTSALVMAAILHFTIGRTIRDSLARVAVRELDCAWFMACGYRVAAQLRRTPCSNHDLLLDESCFMPALFQLTGSLAYGGGEMTTHVQRCVTAYEILLPPGRCGRPLWQRKLRKADAVRHACALLPRDPDRRSRHLLALSVLAAESCRGTRVLLLPSGDARISPSVAETWGNNAGLPTQEDIDTLADIWRERLGLPNRA